MSKSKMLITSSGPTDKPQILFLPLNLQTGNTVRQSRFRLGHCRPATPFANLLHRLVFLFDQAHNVASSYHLWWSGLLVLADHLLVMTGFGFAP